MRILREEFYYGNLFVVNDTSDSDLLRNVIQLFKAYEKVNGVHP